MELIIHSKTYGTYTVLYDECDKHIVDAHKWYLKPSSSRAKEPRFYASTNIGHGQGKQKPVCMHSMFMGKRKNRIIDHANGNTLDNRRCNLRFCTHYQNQQNMKLSTRNTSGYKGVHFVKHIGRWKAAIQILGKKTNIGLYDDPIDAAIAYNREAEMHFGEFARLNDV